MAQQRTGKEAVVAALAAKLDISKAKAAEYVAATFALLIEEIATGEKVQLTGFGSFSVKDYPARTVNSFGVVKAVPAKRVPKFSAGKTLSDRLAAQTEQA